MPPVDITDLDGFPGGFLVHKGLDDLARGKKSEEALLVMIAAPKFRTLGLDVPVLPDVPLPYEHALFSMLEERVPERAHQVYNDLISLVVSFANAYSHSKSRPA